MANQTKVKFLEVSGDYAGQRLDNYLLRELKGLPRSRLYRLLRKGEIRVNKGRVKPNYRLEPADQIRLPPMHILDLKPQTSPSDNLQSVIKDSCLYEDDKLIIFNKPAGIAVHGGSGIQLGLIEAIRQTYQYAERWELVHRLDRDTSGCIMVSKKRSCLRYLHQQLREGHVNKIYWALVNGVWKKAELVNAPLYKHALKSGERMVKVAEQGKASRTQFTPLKQFSGASLVEAKPITGRTHQIRVHAKHAGHTLAGDVKYASDEQNAFWKVQGLQRLFLHAYALELQLADGKEIKVQAPLPAALDDLLKRLD